MAATGCRPSGSLGGQTDYFGDVRVRANYWPWWLPCWQELHVTAYKKLDRSICQLGCPQLDTCDTGVGLENQPAVTGGRT